MPRRCWRRRGVALRRCAVLRLRLTPRSQPAWNGSAARPFLADDRLSDAWPDGRARVAVGLGVHLGESSCARSIRSTSRARRAVRGRARRSPRRRRPSRLSRALWLGCRATRRVPPNAMIVAAATRASLIPIRRRPDFARRADFGARPRGARRAWRGLPPPPPSSVSPRGPPGQACYPITEIERDNRPALPEQMR